MPVLWIAFGLLTCIALFVIAVPVFQQLRKIMGQRALHQQQDGNTTGKLQEATDHKQTNLLLFRDRLSELENDLQEGRLLADEFEQLKQELQRSLLNDVVEEVSSSPAKPNIKRTVALVVIIIIGVPVLAITMYARLGSYQPLQQAQWTEETRRDLAEAGDDMGGMLQRLEDKLAENPSHIEGWILLGRSYLSMQRYPQASRAFQSLIQQLEAQQENPALAYGWLAQSVYFATGQVTPDVQSAISKALEADPNEGNALSLLGIVAFQQQRYEDAIRYWQQILEASPDDPNVDALRSGINRAEELLAERSAVPAQTADSASAGTELQVRLSLSKELLARVGPEDTLFVLARPVGGRMPLAVAKFRAGELPLTVTLNDSMAMGPMAKLSSAEQVEVLARISKSGMPQPQTGDIEGSAGPVNVRQQPVIQLVLDRTVP